MTEAEIKNNMETLKHIHEVRKNIFKLILSLNTRGEEHDKSKLESPESEIFAKYVDKLAETEYGSDEYKELLEKVKPAILHHYSKNRHHVEFHKNGIDDMDLVDLIEMLCDWLAATQRNRNGNIRKSIDINAEKYKISDQLKRIISNTVDRYF